MREVNGDSPKNARIKIDYSKNKPNVTFSYPSKKHQTTGSMLIYIMLFVVLSMFFIGVLYSLIFDSIYNKELRSSADYNQSNFTEFLEYIIENDVLLDMFNEKQSPYTELKNTLIIMDNGKIQPPMFILFGFFLTCLIYFPFRKSWTRIYPKFQGWIAKKKIKTFKDKDIKYNQEENNYFCELPVFNNIVLSYNATKDFSKYLELFEIREHDFKYYLKPGFRKNLLKKRKGKDKVKKRELNENIWYARFYFSKKPIKGGIEVIFK